MRKYLTILISLFFSLSYSQEVEETTIEFSKSMQVKERFYVLKSDSSFKNGEYIEYYRIREDDYNKLAESERGKLLIKSYGNYKNNQKSGHWTIYNKPTKTNGQYYRGQIAEEGVYSADNKIGIWKIYGEHIIEQFDYDSNRYIEPIFNPSCRYPLMAQELGIEGDVVVGYSLDSDCSFSNIRIINGVKELNEEALKYVRSKSNLYHEYMIKLDSCNCENRTDTVRFRLTL